MQKADLQKYLGGLSYPRRLITILLLQFFKLLYHQFAWSYDFVAWVVSVGNWQKWVVSVVPYLNGPRVLEIGFGPGHLQVAMAHRGIIGFGLDESDQMAHMTQRRMLHNGLQPKLLRGAAEKLPFTDGSISQVVITFPAEYILKTATITEIRRVLVSKGTALILPFAWITGRKPWERLVAWINRITGEAPEWDPKALDPLKTAGFEVGWEIVDLSNTKIVLVQLVKV